MFVFSVETARDNQINVCFCVCDRFPCGSTCGDLWPEESGVNASGAAETHLRLSRHGDGAGEQRWGNNTLKKVENTRECFWKSYWKFSAWKAVKVLFYFEKSATLTLNKNKGIYFYNHNIWYLTLRINMFHQHHVTSGW